VSDDAAPLRPTPRYRNVLRHAEAQARRHGHNDLDVEHLLLAILDVGQSVATDVLAKYVDLPDLRKATERALASETYNRPAHPRPDEDARSESAPVTLVRGDERQQAVIHWALRAPSGSGERFRMQLEWSGDPIQVDAGDLFEALVQVRGRLEPEGWFVAVQGARLDVYPSAMQREMASGLNAYVLPTDEPTRLQDIVETLDPAEPGTLATVAAQRAHAEDWERSARAAAGSP
jgi:ClpA/ClpB-like protein